ncbi:hypothetical protein Rhopal_002020-T1 [Rhodotorula paludigena]|uniref:Regulator of chromosome condensation 1/beta-lactamase-inhibitor protein II n=1 Tax=Rhodotorula paludigena TaxID=86838 RepID=A0AAV5G9A6_9BASI|nr:hypothetical protein Rhopal_002020-T1 [Rhodotorula paludigena]
MSDAAANPQDPLSRLPVDLLTDSLLPVIAARDIASLACTCTIWHRFLAGEGGPCEIVWQRRAEREFRFPVRASGRRTGWYALYRSLAASSAYIWGDKGNGRLALPHNRNDLGRLPPALARVVLGGGVPVPARIELPAPPVSLAAGGWSFHALTTSGDVVSWGQLNGGMGFHHNASLSLSGAIVKPMILPQMGELGPIAQLEAGRVHVVMLGEDGRVWEMRSFGRLVEVRDEARRWGTTAHAADDATRSTIAAVQAGWDYAAVLTHGGDIYVWWEPPPAACDEAAVAAGESTLSSPTTEGVAFSLELETLKLPPLPAPAAAADPPSLIACGDDFLLALTQSGLLFYLDLSPVPHVFGQPHPPVGPSPHDSPGRSRQRRARLEAALLDGRRAWQYMPRFCEMNEVAQLDGLGDANISPNTRVTHVSAHFQSFAAYSVPPSSDPQGSIVLLGKKPWRPDPVPEVMPELQNIGVIKIAHGDYHNLALTSSGRIYSWGAYSNGALGLGHPQLSGTPLSIPPVSASQVPPQDAASIPPVPIQRPPERVDKPTRVRFPGETDGADAGEERRDKFVYSVTASGWHSGCLAVDTSSRASASGAQEPLIPLDASTAAQAAEREFAELRRRQDEEQLNGSQSWMGRLGTAMPFRIGFAGRGAARGGGAGRGSG